MSLISRLRDLIHGLVDPDEAPPDHEMRVTMAALLALVARVDGRVLPVEEEGLKAMIGSRFGLSAESVDRLFEDVDALDESADQATTLAGRIRQGIGEEGRPLLLAMAYRIAAIDGDVHEFEDDLVWRLGRLLGLAETEIGAVREDALRRPAPERGGLG